jgi:signal transduction histidine kinase
VVLPIQKDNTLSLIESLPIAVAVITVDAQGRAYMGPGNAAFYALWRLDSNFLETQPTLVFFLEYLRDKSMLPEQTNFAKFRSHVSKIAILSTDSIEEWHLPDGSAFTIKFTPLNEKQYLFIVEDLTPKLKIERAFNEFFQVHQMTLDHLQEGLAVFGSNGFLRLHNPAFALVWQIPDDSLSNNFHMTDFLDATRKVLPVMKNWPEQRLRLSGRLLGRNSGTKHIRCNNGVTLEGAHIPLPDGAVLLRYADISDGIELENTLKERALEMTERAVLLAGADRLKSEFLANLSHEIRTPLTSICGFAELLAENYFGTLNQRQQEYADGIFKASNALSELVSDVMDLSAIEAGLLECNIESFDLHSNLINTLGLVKERARQKKLKLEFDCPIDIGWVNADRKYFRQCLLHLLGNAITYSGSGGIILISACRDFKGVTIKIRDTGNGIPKADLERVFIGFERGNLNDSIKHGAGLGLTLVRALFELQGGQVKITSKLNQGTTVRLFLPNVGILN